MSERKIPVLTEVVSLPGAPTEESTILTDEDIAELQARIASAAYVLMERSLQESLREVEANLLADVIGRLRAELPDLIDDALRERLASHPTQR